MKLLCFNIAIKIDNSHKVAKFIEAKNCEIVLLQESLRHFEESVFDMYKVDMHIKSVIGKKYPYSFFGPLWYTNKMLKNGKVHLDFNGFIEQGNEILSKFPLLKSVNHFFYGSYELKLDWTDFKTHDHARSILFSILDINGKKVQVVNIHGSYSADKQDNERSFLQCETILKLINQTQLPTIIAGDFNLFPDTKSIALFEDGFRNLIQEYKITSTRPDFKDSLDEGNNVVDYIFVNNKIKVNSFTVDNTDISDHLPLILDFDVLD